MKKPITLFLALMLFSSHCIAQDNLLFKVFYSPRTVYTQRIESSTDTEMHFRASEDILQQIKNSGVSNPMKLSENSSVESVIYAEEAGADGRFPVKAEIRRSVNGQQADYFVMSGHCDQGAGVPVFDSLVSEDLDEQGRLMALNVLKGMLSNVSYPEKNLKIGDEFSFSIPLSTPMRAGAISIDVNTTLKLVSISDGNGYFDSLQAITMDMDVEGTPMRIEGTGSGKMIYDIENHFVVLFDSDMDMTMKMSAGGVDLEGRIKARSVQRVEISN